MKTKFTLLIIFQLLVQSCSQQEIEKLYDYKVNFNFPITKIKSGDFSKSRFPETHNLINDGKKSEDSIIPPLASGNSINIKKVSTGINTGDISGGIWTGQPRKYWWWKKRQRKLMKRVKNCSGKSVVFLGDSITQRWEVNGVFIRNTVLKDYKIINLGMGGDRVENLQYRLNLYPLEKCSVDAVIIMIGTNNTHFREKPEKIAEEVKQVILLTRKKMPDADIFLYAIFPRGHKPNPYRANNANVNSIIRKYEDGRKIFYYDISRSFTDEKGIVSKKIMKDYLHLTSEGYRIWATHLKKILQGRNHI
ncbi:MAG: hypothetical protein JXR95_01080 [Deltaproteobacteria bacterium]|nr:hypothetical protein [Deltaproteobacteria bacterium]